MTDNKRWEEIYLNEDRYDTPREYFKLVGNQIKQGPLLDIGCANGAFIHYLRSVNFRQYCTGIDISQKMINAAATKMLDGKWVCADFLNYGSKTYDNVTMFGVLSTMPSAREALTAAANYVAPGGCLFVFSAFNSYPLTVSSTITNHSTGKVLTRTIHSRKECEATLAGSSWIDFNMPFAIEKTPDPMRSWTVEMDDKLQLVNGAGQKLDFAVMVWRNRK